MNNGGTRQLVQVRIATSRSLAPAEVHEFVALREVRKGHPNTCRKQNGGGLCRAPAALASGRPPY